MKIHRAIRNFTLISLLLCVAPARSFADTLSEAKDLEDKGKIEGAVSLYGEWLDGHPGDDNFIRVLGRYCSLQTKVESSIDFLSEIVSKVENKKNKQAVYRKLGQLFLLSGTVEQAQQNYERAAMTDTEKKDFTSFILSSRLLLEMGIFDRAESQARTVLTFARDPKIKNKAKIVLAYSAFLRESPEEGRKILEELCSGSTIETLDQEDLGMCSYLAQKEGEKDLIARTVSELKKRFPESPEYGIAAASGRIDIMSSPLYLLVPGEYTGKDKGEGREMTGNREETAKPASSAVRVQTGVFSNRENAEDFVSRLARSGFTAEIVKVERSGRDYYKVLSAAMPEEESQNYILRLKECGFEGFLLFD